MARRCPPEQWPAIKERTAHAHRIGDLRRRDQAGFKRCLAGLGANAAGMALSAKVFVPAWLAVACANMWVGVHHAGYSAREEFPDLAAGQRGAHLGRWFGGVVASAWA